MSYYIAYGIETESLEDPDQLRLLSLPDEVADMDNDNLVAYIGDYWQDINSQPLVGFTDVVESLRLLMRAEQLHDDTVQRIIAGLIDAVDNNS